MTDHAIRVTGHDKRTISFQVTIWRDAIDQHRLRLVSHGGFEVEPAERMVAGGRRATLNVNNVARSQLPLTLQLMDVDGATVKSWGPLFPPPTWGTDGTHGGDEPLPSRYRLPSTAIDVTSDPFFVKMAGALRRSERAISRNDQHRADAAADVERMLRQSRHSTLLAAVLSVLGVAMLPPEGWAWLSTVVLGLGAVLAVAAFRSYWRARSHGRGHREQTAALTALLDESLEIRTRAVAFGVDPRRLLDDPHPCNCGPKVTE